MKKQTVILSAVALLFIAPILLFSDCFAQTINLSDQIRVMSFNIRVDTGSWSGRCDKVCQIIRDHNPDIIGVQEALLHQVEQIQQQLPGYTNYAVGRSDGLQKGESCAIYYKTDRFQLNEKGTFWFSDTPDEVSHGWDTWPRICTWLYLTDKNTGKGFYVYNVHLAAFFSQGARQKSVRLLTQRIADRKTDDPFIVIGDFNMKTTNSAMKYFLNIDGETDYPRMTDAWDAIYPDQRGPRWDHITVCPDVKTLTIKLDERKASDHHALIADLLISPNVQNIAAENDQLRPARN